MTRKYARIKDSVRAFGGEIWEIADAEISYDDALLLVDPNSGEYVYFTNNEVDREW